MDDTERFKRDCFARYVLQNWEREKIDHWVSKKSKEYQKDIKERLNDQQIKLRRKRLGK